jgi:acyl-CoA dehydrogenase
MGQRGTKTCDVILDNVRVPAANIIGGVPGQGFKTAMKVLDRGRLNISADLLRLGLTHPRREPVTYARDRKQFGKPHWRVPARSRPCWRDSQAELLAGWALVRETDVALRFDLKPPHVSRPRKVSMQASCAKLFSTEMVGRVADRGVQIHGGAGYINEYPVERFYRDARLLRLYEGTTQVQQIVIGKRTVARGLTPDF